MISVLQFLTAALEFFLINWLGRHSISERYYQISFASSGEEAPLFNLVFRVLAPTIFLVLTASIWYAIGADEVVANYWLVTVYYFAVRWGFNVVMGRARLLRWANQIAIASLAIALSMLVSRHLLADREILLPSPRGLTDELWIVVIGFVYLTISRIRLPTLERQSEEKKSAYIIARFNKLRERYGKVVTSEADGLAAEAIAFSIMIFETFNRPTLYQWIERYVLFPAGFAHTLGPMQVTTPVAASQDSLVREGVRVVNGLIAATFESLRKHSPGVLLGHPPSGSDVDVNTITFDKAPSYGQYDIVRGVAERYNPDASYAGEVVGIFMTIRDKYYPALIPTDAQAG